MVVDERGRLLTPQEAAEAVGVHPKTLQRWAKQHLIREVRTPGGHRRYWEEDIRSIRDGETIQSMNEDER